MCSGELLQWTGIAGWITLKNKEREPISSFRSAVARAKYQRRTLNFISQGTKQNKCCFALFGTQRIPLLISCLTGPPCASVHTIPRSK